MHESQFGNPIIRHKYTADPTVIIHDDTVYLYTGHDEAPVGTEGYLMNEWLCFSSKDLVNWTEHSPVLKATDFLWAKDGAFATWIVSRNKKFYWFTSVNHKSIKGTAIGVAVSSSPTGPFVDAIGKALITSALFPGNSNEKVNLDPGVIISNDGEVFLFWGNKQCHYVKLSDDMLHIDGEIKAVDLPDFEEGSHIHFRNGWYYLSYGYQMPEKVAYAMSRSIHGPWEFKGILNEIAGNCETNRPCIVEFKKEHYFFYHNGALPNGGSHRRSVCVDRLVYNDDGTMRLVMMTSEGISSSI